MIDFVNQSYDTVGMEFYHLVNHAVEFRDLFLDTQDYARFVHDLYEFNDSRPALNAGRPYSVESYDMIDFVNQSLERERIVDIHAWCLMKNHYHLLVSERVEGGITKFLRKLNVGFANYTNDRYGRHGTLFRGRTKKVLIVTNEHLYHVVHYIHLNPLDYLPGAEFWRQGHIAYPSTAFQYLRDYRWSSFQDYTGQTNFPSILYRDFVDSIYPTYDNTVTAYLTGLRSSTTEILSPEYRCERE